MIKAEKFNKNKEGRKIVKYYIAYGSNMDLDQMSYRVRDSIFIGTGYIEGYRLEFKSKYASIEEEENSSVPVVIFGISEEDEIRLDRYEGYPELYYKKEVKVKVRDNQEELDCMVYIMEKGYKYQLPEVNYYINIEKSYRVFGFELGILEQALIESYKKTETTRYSILQEEYVKILVDCKVKKVISTVKSENLEELLEEMLKEVDNKTIISGEIEGIIYDKSNRVIYYTSGNKVYEVEEESYGDDYEEEE